MRRARTLLLGLLLAGVVAGCTSAPGDAAGERVGSVPAEAPALAGDPGTASYRIAADLPPCPDGVPGSQVLEPTGRVGGGLPALTLECLDDGPAVTLSDLRGRPLLLNVWASWCPPCIAEMPMLSEVALEAPEDLLVLGVDIEDVPGAALSLAAELDLAFASVVDTGGEVRAALLVPGPPVTFFVTADGVITGRHDGRIPDRAALDRLLAEYLGIGG